MTSSPPRTTRSLWFWNLIAKSYSKQAVSNEDAYQHKLAQTQSYLNKDMTVLEFGCGTGTTALIHAPFVARVDGIDYAPKMVDIARAKVLEGKVPNAAFHVAAIEDWPRPDTPYDVVMGMSILHLVQDRASVLAHVREMLAPGGLFISSTTCLDDIGGFVSNYVLPVGSALRLLPNLGHVSAKGLAKEIEQAGFEIVETWRPGPKDAVFMVARAV